MTPDGDLLVARELAGALSSSAIAASALGKRRRGRLEPAVDRLLADDHHRPVVQSRLENRGFGARGRHCR
jgi:hypothetical protein